MRGMSADRSDGGKKKKKQRRTIVPEGGDWGGVTILSTVIVSVVR